MKEFFAGCEHVPYTKVRGVVLLDTCFIISSLSHHKGFSGSKRIATTSFNVEELLHVNHRLGHELKSRMRKFFKDTDLLVLDVPVSPGDREAERSFVLSVDDRLLANVPDPSDAVLMAVAIKTGSIVVTKDKHHLFTEKLEEFIHPYNIQVYKDLKFLE